MKKKEVLELERRTAFHVLSASIYDRVIGNDNDRGFSERCHWRFPLDDTEVLRRVPHCRDPEPVEYRPW